ncbi:MAG TPA: toll/interleukin-1 receptor domain-containing protein [Polyangiaceae bacterium]|nr:toll/interleukin-1 receptor domain-containing protein [Polyangiaceae bacterium]
MQIVHRFLVQSGDWPVFYLLDHAVDSELGEDAAELLNLIEPGLLLFDPYFQPTSRVSLTAAGLHRIGTAETEGALAAFWGLVQLALNVQGRFEPSAGDPYGLPRITHAEVEARLRIEGELVTPGLARRAFMVFASEGLYSSTAGPDDDGRWSFTVGRDFRRWRTVETVDEFIRLRNDERAQRSIVKSAQPQDGDRVFVSFAQRDKALAVRFTDFLRGACNLREEQVFLTARPGELEPGAQFVDAIRSALEGACFAVLLLTPSYYESHFCLAELGAVWGLERVCAPVIVPPVDFAALDGVQLGQQALRIDQSQDLDVLRDQVRGAVRAEATTPEWNRQRDAFLNDWDARLSHDIAEIRTVPASDYRVLQADLELLANDLTTAQEESQRRMEYASHLRADNERLRAGGTVEEAAPQLSPGDEQAERIAQALAAIEDAAELISTLPKIVRGALYRHYSAKQPLTVGGQADDFDPAEAGREVDEGFLIWDPAESGLVWPRFDNPRMEEVKFALDRVRSLAFDGDPMMDKAKAGPWFRPVLKERFAIEDAEFELAPTWRKLGLLPV